MCIPPKKSSLDPKLVMDGTGGKKVLRLKKVACGDSHSAALDESGRVFIWGSYKTQDGYQCFPDYSMEYSTSKKSTPTTSRRSIPNRIRSESDVHKLKTVKCSYFPQMIPPLYFEGVNIVDIVCGSNHTVCLTELGEVFTFGTNCYGQLGWSTRKEEDDSPYCNPECDENVTRYLFPKKVFKWGSYVLKEGCKAFNCYPFPKRVFKWGSYVLKEGFKAVNT